MELNLQHVGGNIGTSDSVVAPLKSHQWTHLTDDVFKLGGSFNAVVILLLKCSERRSKGLNTISLMKCFALCPRHIFVLWLFQNRIHDKNPELQ